MTRDRAGTSRPVILALDCARKCGYAYAAAGDIPISGVWTLRTTDQPMDWEPGALIKEILALIDQNGGCKPDLIVREATLSAAAKWQPKENGRAYAQSQSIKSQERLAGAVLAFASVSGIKCVDVAASTARKAVCGTAKGTWTGDKKPTAEQQRNCTKIMVRDTMIRFGLVPPGTTALDQTDAVCVWAWAEKMVVGRLID